MGKLRGCAIKAWDIALSVSLFYFALVGLGITHAGVSPFIKSKTISQNFRTSKGHNESSVSNRFKGVRVGLESVSYFELSPNGTLLVGESKGNGTNTQNILLLKAVLGGLKTSRRRVVGNTKGSIKIYGDGIEHKFPPFLEHIIQRIQTYFSVYKYTDTSAVESSTVPVENISYHVDTTTSAGLESTTQEDKSEYNEFIEIGKHDIDVIVVGVD